jgi:predicted flap endonuclease-1-like 5' DNA nuclease
MTLTKKLNSKKTAFTVSFSYTNTEAKNVQLLGEFNNWDGTTKVMKASKGTFTQDVELAAGKSYEFRYLIDGQSWDNDHNADNYVNAPYAGVQNSVVILDALPTSTKTSNADKPVKAVKATTVTKEKVTKTNAAPKKETKVVASKVTKEVKPAAKKEVKAVAKKSDDLTLIEGVGPKIAELLVKAGMTTFADVAKTKVADLKKVLESAGSRYTMHDPSTWAKQADLAAKGKMAELKKLQDELVGGKKK